MRRLILIGILAVLLEACSGTPPSNLGVHEGQLAACPRSPNCVSSQASDEEHRITPLRFSGTAEAAFQELKQVLAARKDTKIVEDRGDYLRVELHTTLFVDDAEFLLDRKDHLIHLRSASRIGYSDLGKNRSRIEDIRRAFDAVNGETSSGESTK